MNKTSEGIIQKKILNLLEYFDALPDREYLGVRLDNSKNRKKLAVSITKEVLEAVEEARRETIEEVLSLVQIPASQSRTEKEYLISVSEIQKLKESKLEGGKPKHLNDVFDMVQEDDGWIKFTHKVKPSEEKESVTEIEIGSKVEHQNTPEKVNSNTSQYTSEESWEEYVKEWSKQGRTEEQIWAVRNFMTGQGALMIQAERQKVVEVLDNIFEQSEDELEVEARLVLYLDELKERKGN